MAEYSGNYFNQQFTGRRNVPDTLKKFTRIKYLDKEEAVELEFDEVIGDLSKHSVVKGTSAPDPKLVETLRAFKPEMLYILELPEQYGEDMEVHQVSISYPAEKRGIVISAKRPVKHANSPFVPKTPFLVEPEDASQAGMTETMTTLLDELCVLAGEYLAGHRAQHELPLNGNGNGAQMDIEESTAALSDQERTEAIRAVTPLLEKAFPGNFRGGALSDNEITLALSNAFDDVEYIDEGSPDHLKFPHVLQHVPEVAGTDAPLVVWCAVSAEPAFWYGINPGDKWIALLPTFNAAQLIAIVREMYEITEPEPVRPAPAAGDKLKVSGDMRRTYVIRTVSSERVEVEHTSTGLGGAAVVDTLVWSGLHWVARELFPIDAGLVAESDKAFPAENAQQPAEA